jgi:hypothetical protein
MQPYPSNSLIIDSTPNLKAAAAEKSDCNNGITDGLNFRSPYMGLSLSRTNFSAHAFFSLLQYLMFRDARGAQVCIHGTAACFAWPR